MKQLKSTDYAVSCWSGGKTTELTIAPEGAKYADRDFLFRISSATVEQEESVFTPLPDYMRWIAPLSGKMVLRHNGGEAIELRPFAVHCFDGADKTESRGKCTDFNLMLRKGKCTGTLAALSLRRGGALPLGFTGTHALVYTVRGRLRVLCGYREIQAEAGEALLWEGSDGAMTLIASEDAVLMTAEITVL